MFVKPFHLFLPVSNKPFGIRLILEKELAKIVCNVLCPFSHRWAFFGQKVKSREIAGRLGCFLVDGRREVKMRNSGRKLHTILLSVITNIHSIWNSLFETKRKSANVLTDPLVYSTQINMFEQRTVAYICCFNFQIQ